MAKKRGPGRPPLSAAEKARRKAEREALKASAAPKRRGRKPGRKPGRPAKFVAAVKRGRKPAGAGYPLLAAEVTERFLALEKSMDGAVCTIELADRLGTLEAVYNTIKENFGSLTKALQTVADQAAHTEAKLSQLCQSLNNYFNNNGPIPVTDASVATEETAAVVNQ